MKSLEASTEAHAAGSEVLPPAPPLPPPPPLPPHLALSRAQSQGAAQGSAPAASREDPGARSAYVMVGLRESTATAGVSAAAGPGSGGGGSDRDRNRDRDRDRHRHDADSNRDRAERDVSERDRDRSRHQSEAGNWSRRELPRLGCKLGHPGSCGPATWLALTAAALACIVRRDVRRPCRLGVRAPPSASVPWSWAFRDCSRLRRKPCGWLRRAAAADDRAGG